MPSTVLTLKYKIGANLVISPSSLIDEYMHGIPLVDINGRSYSFLNIKKKILESTIKVENFLKIKIMETTITEEQDYLAEEWMNFGHIKCNYKVQEVLAVDGYLNSEKVVSFTKEMFTKRGKNIALVPSSGNVSSMVWFGTAGATPLLRGGLSKVPNFWHISYKTGFSVLPLDLLLVICKLATMQILAVLGDIVVGVGVASESISFDGLSQSFSSTQSSGNSVFSARIKQYAEEVKDGLESLKAYYRGIIFEVL